MEENIPKSHGMSPEKASRVKKRGHNKEHIFVGLIGGEIVKGTKKQDVKGKHGQLYSIKGGSEVKEGDGREGRWAIFLLKESKFEEDKEFPAREIFLKILRSYPKEHSEYEKAKDTYKRKIIPYMVELKKFLLNKSNLSLFLDKAFFDKRIDFFVVYDDDIFHIFDKGEVWNTLLNNLEVDNSSTFQKVVLKLGNLCGEIEVRTTDDGKYPCMLFVMNKRITFDLLKDKISRNKDFTPVIRLYGSAIENFNE